MKHKTSALLAIMTVIAALAVSPALAGPKAKKKAVKKGDPYESSKYKSYRVLTGEENKSYRFDSHGNPIPPASEKKAKKKEGGGEKGGEQKPVPKPHLDKSGGAATAGPGSEAPPQ